VLYSIEALVQDAEQYDWRKSLILLACTPLRILMLIAVFLWLSATPFIYWDETFYLYSVLQHEPQTLFELDGQLTGLFPIGFFLSKTGFVYFLDFLVDMLGSGPQVVYLIQWIFALIVLGFIYVCYLLYQEIIPTQQVFGTTVILAFIPISSYLGFKVLSEMPSLFLASLACLSLLRSFSAGKKSVCWINLGFACVTLIFACLVRYPSIALFVGMAAGLFLFLSERYPRPQVFLRSTMILVLSVILLFFFWGLLIDDPITRLSGVVANLAQRDQTWLVRFYAVLVSLQTFLPLLLLGCFFVRDNIIRFALFWLFVVTVPFMISTSYVEPRFLYMALVPAAILIHRGWCAACELFPERWRNQVGMVLLITLVLINRFTLMPVMPYEIDKNNLAQFLTRNSEKLQGSTVLVPWLSDYCYLRFAYPELDVRLAMNWFDTGNTEFFRSQPFQKWIESDGYVRSVESLEALSSPLRYFAWDYNPAVKKIKQRAKWIGISGLSGLEKMEGQKDHRTLSWVWHSGRLRLNQLDTNGHYWLFGIDRKL